MQTINRFFMWWKESFSKQGIVGKVVLGCSSLFVICCLCSVPIGILSPKPSGTATVEVASTFLVTQIEKPTEIILPTNITESTKTPLSIETQKAVAATQTLIAQYNPSSLNCPGGQGDLEFCLVNPQLVNNQSLFEFTLETYCNENLKTGGFCHIMVWTDSNYIPTSLPMTDEQSNNQVAQFNRNDSTAYKCFWTLSGGNDIYRSAGC